MSAFEDTVNEYLKTMGVVITLPFSDVPGTNPPLRLTRITHMNLNLVIVVHGMFFWPLMTIGYLPKQNVAPLFRRLLDLNGRMGGPYFLLGENNAISLSIIRQQEGLDLPEFKWMLDQMCGMYWQCAAGLIQEFQLPQQPG